MSLMRTLLTNHPLVNIFFSVVLVMGFLSYVQMPREQDPEINFNFVNINTVLPGATAADVEQLVTGPLEDALRQVKDIRFISSSSREGVSDILVRFRELSQREFDKRVTDLRRDIQAKANDELPEDAEDPFILEINTSNGFPTATVLVAGQAFDESLRRQAKLIKEELEALKGVDGVNAFGFNEPELHIEIDPLALATQGLTASNVADQIRAAYRDVSAGKVDVGTSAWNLRIQGKTVDPEVLAQFLLSPPAMPQRKVALDQVARIRRAQKEAFQMVSYQGRPAISMAVTKVAFTNTLELVDRIRDYVDAKNQRVAASGIELILADDQTVATRQAVGIMQTNALLGLSLVLLVCWLFLGLTIASFVTMGIAFSIAGTFWVLNMTGNTVNVPVLLGIVIVLGMLVDDAVVVVEALYYRLQRGQEAVTAALASLGEVGKPVTSAVFTTISAFAPLMLLPGIIGEFMMIVPLVVTTGLLVSLIEAFWILPAHVISSTRRHAPVTDQLATWRGRWTHWVRMKYTRALAYVFRRPLRFFTAGILAFFLAAGALATGAVKANFFTLDPLRLFYVNLDMPPEATLEETLAQVDRIQASVRPLLLDEELRALSGMAGIKFTDTEALYGDNYGQVMVSLNPQARGGRNTQEIMAAVRDAAVASGGNGEITFFLVTGGPPVAKDISLNVRGDEYEVLRAGADAVMDIVRGIPGSENIVDNDVPGRQELTLQLDYRAIREAGLSPGEVARLLRLHLDGEIIAFTRDRGEKIELRVRGMHRSVSDVAVILDDPVLLPGGGTTTFRALTTSEISRGSGTIRHYNFRRSITVEADLGPDSPDTLTATAMLREQWAQVQDQYPGVDLDFAGAFDDLQESLDSMLLLFLFGLGLIYLILATQFRSYFQPMLILATVPMAFTGVVLGLFVTGYALSLYTLYGVVALTGIAVNAAIVLIDATNSRIRSGMRTLHAIMYAARRRVIPILMTSMTTIAGLFSLATGLGGKSAIWGPVATSMVFGLFVATIMTLFLMPVLFRAFIRLRDPAVRAGLFPTLRGRRALKARGHG